MQREMGPVDASLEFMTEDVCKGHFDELGVSELKNIFQGRGGSGRNYEINSMIKGILTALQKHNWIYRFATIVLFPKNAAFISGMDSAPIRLHKIRGVRFSIARIFVIW